MGRKKKKINFTLDDTPKESVEELFEDFKVVCKVKNKKKIYYLNVSSAFDIESTSFKEDKEKRATMYAWVFGLNGKIIVGRTWQEFINVCHKLHDYYNLSESKRLIVYVHNLSFEFQWFRKLFKWKNVFALSEREVAYCISDLGIEFRCSYILTGYSLAKLGEQCINYPVQKMVGDLDYSLYRHSKTPLTPKEWKYIYNDALVVMSYIQQCIEQEKIITRIPLTKTGYVRRYVRNLCLKKGNYTKYRHLMNSMKIQSIEEYKQLKRAFIGGHSHANALCVNETLEDVTSMDFTSSYPYCMLSEKYPVSKGEKIQIHNREEFEENIKKYCCVFDVRFTNIESTFMWEHVIPKSKCTDIKNCVEDNGKIVKAESITMTLTEVDYISFSKFYKWESMAVNNFRRYRKGYLPKQIIQAVLTLYQDKTTLKNVKGKEIEYQHAKENLNSCYGMTVTSVDRMQINYENDEWSKDLPNLEELLNKYNSNQSRVLFYAWGIYVTSYAKRNLFSGIYELKGDYLYSDTDSVKFLNYNKHITYFNEYNKLVESKLNKMLEHYKLDKNLIHPKTIEGKEKLIGVWDYDGYYKRARFLGSKRYMVQYDDDSYSFTVAGCNKKKAIPYMLEIAKDKKMDPLDLFTDELFIPSDYTGKNTHTYLDYRMEGEITDYLGVTYHYEEESGVHLEPTEFTLSLSDRFKNYLYHIKEVYR
jgi:hypothetical protein